MDLALTTKGDLIIGPNGDLMFTESVDQQAMLLRLFVNDPDYYPFPNFGANLEDYLGLSIVQSNLDRIVTDLKRKLKLTSVVVIPDHKNNFITINLYHPQFVKQLKLVFSLDSGLLVDEAENILVDVYTGD